MRTLSTLLALPNHALLRPIEVARLTGISRQGVDYAIRSQLLPSEFSGRATRVRKAAALAYQANNKWTGRRGRHLQPMPKACVYCGKGFTGIRKARYCSSPCCYKALYRRNRARHSDRQDHTTRVIEATEK